MKNIFYITLFSISLFACGGNLNNAFKTKSREDYSYEPLIQERNSQNQAFILRIGETYVSREINTNTNTQQEVSYRIYKDVSNDHFHNDFSRRMTLKKGGPDMNSITDLILLYFIDFNENKTSGKIIYANSLRVFDAPVHREMRRYEKYLKDTTNVRKKNRFESSIIERSHYIRQILKEDSIIFNSFGLIRIGTWERSGTQITIKLPAESDEATSYFKLLGTVTKEGVKLDYVTNPSSDLLSRRIDRVDDTLKITDFINIQGTDTNGLNFKKIKNNSLYYKDLHAGKKEPGVRKRASKQLSIAQPISDLSYGSKKRLGRKKNSLCIKIHDKKLYSKKQRINI
jgi:hypothetical protein